MKTSRIRALVLGGVFSLFFVLLIAKLYWVQVVDASSLMHKAEQNWSRSEMLIPQRGMIVDRNGKVLATEVEAYTVAVDPKLIHKKGIASKVVQALAPILDMTSPSELQKLKDIVNSKQKNGDFYIQREIRNEGWKISRDKADRIRAAIQAQGLSGIYLLKEQKRDYPSGSLAAHVLGYTSKDGKAVSGLEYYYDKLLQGKKGSIRYKKDALGYELPNSKVVYNPPVNGKTLQLTIDQNIQTFTENALKKTYDKYQPKSAMAIVVDPQTMDVLAMASYPTFDPNQYWNYDINKDFIDHNVVSVYEPGSTFKVVTLAGTVEQGIFHPDEKYQSGTINITGTLLRDWNNGAGWGKITYLEGLDRSSNVAFVRLGYKGLGPDKLTYYIKKFGFGQKTGIDLPGEDPGMVAMHYPIEYATATYGQGKINVTPIQLASAYAAIANGGKLLQPHIVKNIIDPATNQVVKTFKPALIRQVVPPAVAAQTSAYLRTVITGPHGTGRDAAIPGYAVVGKTGTASVVVNGKYADAEHQYLCSFIGYAPAAHPRVEVLVMVDRPNIPSYHEGGKTTMPVFKEIMSNTLRYLGIPSNDQTKEQVAMDSGLNTVPDVTGLAVQNAEARVRQNGYKDLVLGSGDKVTAQYPAGGSSSATAEKVYLLTGDVGKAAFPDLSGQSMRDALEVCSILHATCKVQGQGYVQSQKITGTGSNRQVTLNMSSADSSINYAYRQGTAQHSSSGQKQDPTGKGQSQSGSGQHHASSG